MTTDYASDRGRPEPYLARIAAAGFTHVHWCHHWASDFVYNRPEIAQIRRWLADCGLAVLDIHASAGQEKRWGSKEEYERLAGVELVANRLEMAAELGAGSIVLHARAGEPLES
jgi:sugar phosphate isomerase/epimerase